ncbi:hypothetical protein E2542_SST10704 [Spatholobus suberectus]|nr:hypothetical protein E2542_SST10704 [Spatholobus suberectus]
MDSNFFSGRTTSELEALQKEHEEKTLKIQELKRQIELTKHLLEEKKNKVTEERKAVFNTLSERYNSLREEHNALLAEKKRGSVSRPPIKHVYVRRNKKKTDSLLQCFCG